MFASIQLRKKYTLMIMCSSRVVQAILDTAMCIDQQLNDKCHIFIILMNLRFGRK